MVSRGKESDRAVRAEGHLICVSCSLIDAASLFISMAGRLNGPPRVPAISLSSPIRSPDGTKGNEKNKKKKRQRESDDGGSAVYLRSYGRLYGQSGSKELRLLYSQAWN